jgi:hypothetical protein
MTRSERSNLRLLPIFSFFAEFFPIAPVLVAWYGAHGLDATAVFAIQASFAACMVAFEVPSGFVADALGRRTALLLGALFWPLGLLLYRLGGTFGAFVLAEATIAVAASLYSGCVSALLFDTLGSLGRSGEYQRREGGLAATARLGTLIGALLGGLLAARSLAWPFDLNLFSFCLLLPVTLALFEPVRERPALRKAWSEILAVGRTCMTRSDLRPWIFGVGFLGTVGRVVIWSSFLAFADWDVSLAWNGAMFALLQLGGMLGGRSSAFLRQRLGNRAFRWLLAMVAPLLAAFAIWPHPASVAIFPLVTFLWNAGLPYFYAGLNERTESRVRATVLSVANLVGNLLFVVVAPAFGALVDATSLSWGFGTLGLFSLGAMGWVALRLSATENRS